MGSHSADTTSSAAENAGRENSSSMKHQLGTSRLSQKISKQPILAIRKPNAAVAGDTILPSITQPPPSADSTAPPQQPHQPPVYNVSKDDFRELVQRLTGAPPRPPPPPPQDQAPAQPPATSSRLHRIRPPPLMRCPVATAIPFSDNTNPMAMARPGHPISPLPPLPGVHVAAESPVSAYMRRLRSSSTTNPPSCLSPLAPPPPPVAPHINQSPLSPLQHRMIPQVPLFPPTSPSQLMGFPFPQLPLSPTVGNPRP